jgi:hypothetical protein
MNSRVSMPTFLVRNANTLNMALPRTRCSAPAADCPYVNECKVDWETSFSRRSLDRTDCDDVLAFGDELLGDEMNVTSAIEAREEALEYVLEPLEMTVSDGHAFGHVVDDVWRLDSPESLPMSRDGSFVKSTNELLVVLAHPSLLL